MCSASGTIFRIVLVKLFRMQNIIGTNLRTIRLARSLTQEQLAANLQLKGCSFSRNTVAKIEAGIRQVTDVEIKLLAQVLEVSISQLFGEENLANS